MTLPIERARTRRPVTWLTVIGALLLPVVIGAILVAAFYDPAERLDGVTAAIVNDDDPVTIDDQLVPLGRQLSAGLVEGSDPKKYNEYITLPPLKKKCGLTPKNRSTLTVALALKLLF